MTYVKWFRTEEGAKAYQKKHGGIICRNVPRSHTKSYHLQAASALGFNPDDFKYSVHKNEV